MFRKRIDYDFIFYFYNLQLIYRYLISFNKYQPLQIVQFFGKALTPIKIQLNCNFSFFKSKYIPYLKQIQSVIERTPKSDAALTAYDTK